MDHRQLCPKFEAAFQLLEKRWTGLIIYTLLDGPKHFREISQLIPQMSDRMLAIRFKELEDAGIVCRTVFPTRPVRIDYELTEKGHALKPVMDSVQHWADVWIKEFQHTDG